MQLVERHIRVNDKAIEDICFKTARLYNFCNFHKRQVYFGKIEKFGEYELSSLLCEYNQEDFRALPSVVKLIVDSGLAFNPVKLNLV